MKTVNRKKATKKQNIWGLFKNFLQLDEKEAPRPQEPEDQDEEFKRIRKIDLGYFIFPLFFFGKESV